MSHQQRIGVPKRVFSGQGLSADYLNTMRQAIASLVARYPRYQFPTGFDTLPAFSVFLRVEPGSPATFFASVSPGYFINTDKTAGIDTEAHSYTAPNNQFDVDGYLEEFEIAVDEAIFISVYELTTGQPNLEQIKIEVLAKDTKSLNYTPGSPDQEGIYYYKLAELITGDAGVPELKNYAAGSHIYKTSGKTLDFRVLGCDPDPLQEGPGYDPPQLARLSFLSGIVVSNGESIDDVPLFPATEECYVYECT